MGLNCFFSFGFGSVLSVATFSTSRFEAVSSFLVSVVGTGDGDDFLGFSIAVDVVPLEVFFESVLEVEDSDDEVPSTVFVFLEFPPLVDVGFGEFRELVDEVLSLLFDLCRHAAAVICSKFSKRFFSDNALSDIFVRKGLVLVLHLVLPFEVFVSEGSDFLGLSLEPLPEVGAPSTEFVFADRSSPRGAINSESSKSFRLSCEFVRGEIRPGTGFVSFFSDILSSVGDLTVRESFTFVITEGDSGVFGLLIFEVLTPSTGELLLLFPCSTTLDRFFAILSRLSDFAVLVDFCIGDSTFVEEELLRMAETW